MLNLIHGDCLTELAHVTNCLGNKPFCIVTDPPFNIGYHYDEYKDTKSESEYIKSLLSLIGGGENW